MILLSPYRLVSNWVFRYSGIWHCRRVSGSWCFGETWCHRVQRQEVQEDCFWTSWPRRWRHCVSLKRWQALTLYHIAVLQETESSAAPLLEPPVISLAVSAHAELLNASIYYESTRRAVCTVRLSKIYDLPHCFGKTYHFNVAVWKPTNVNNSW